MRTFARTLLVWPGTILLAGALGCMRGEPTLQERASPEATLPAPVVPIGAAASLAGYRSWGMVDDRLAWAPLLCRPLTESDVTPELRLSTADQEAGHGRKVYLLYARYQAAYRAGGDQPSGQVLIKESWYPEVRDKQPNQGPTLQRDGTWLVPGGSNGLFVMSKGDALDPASDAGWTYMTVSPAGRVTARGKLANCMACHQDAPGDRVFGLPR